MGEFTDALAVSVDDAGDWTAEVAEGWDIGGHPHGGYLMALAARIALGVTGREHPLSVTAHFLRSPAMAPVAARTSLLRTGRMTAVAAVDLYQAGRPVLASHTTAGAVPGSPTPVFRDGGAPVLPPPADCFALDDPAYRLRSNLHRLVDMRLDPATASWQAGSPSGTAAMRGWVRLADGSAPDPLFLLLALDALPPIALDFGASGWVPTVELSALIRAVPAPGWLRVVMRTRLIDDGWFDEDMEVWDSADRLVAQGRQLAVFRSQPADLPPRYPLGSGVPGRERRLGAGEPESRARTASAEYPIPAQDTPASR